MEKKPHVPILLATEFNTRHRIEAIINLVLFVGAVGYYGFLGYKNYEQKQQKQAIQESRERIKVDIWEMCHKGRKKTNCQDACEAVYGEAVKDNANNDSVPEKYGHLLIKKVEQGCRENKPVSKWQGWKKEKKNFNVND